MALNEKVAQKLGNLQLTNIQLEERLEQTQSELTNLKAEYQQLLERFENLNTTSTRLLLKSNTDNEALKGEVRELRALLETQTLPAHANVESVKNSSADEQPTQSIEHEEVIQNG